MLQQVNLKDITVDKDLNFRDGLDPETVARYEEGFDSLPAIVLVKDGKTLILADGFHRH